MPRPGSLPEGYDRGDVLAQPTNLLQFRGSAVLIMDDIAWEIRAKTPAAADALLP